MHGRLVSRRIDALPQCFLVLCCCCDRIHCEVRRHVNVSVSFRLLFSLKTLPLLTCSFLSLLCIQVTVLITSSML